MMKPSHTLPGQARTSLLQQPCFVGFRGPRRPISIGPITRFTRYLSVRRRNRPRAHYLDDMSSMPASTRPQSDLTRTHQSTRRRKVVGYAPWSWCMSVSGATATRATPSMPADVPMAIRGWGLAVATTLVMVDSTTVVRTEARALTCRDLRRLADTS